MRLRMHRKKAFSPLRDTSYFPDHVHSDITVSIRSRRRTFRLRKCLVFTASLRKLSPLASVRMTFGWIKADLETIGCLGSGLNNQSAPRLLLRSNTRRKTQAEPTKPDQSLRLFDLMKISGFQSRHSRRFILEYHPCIQPHFRYSANHLNREQINTVWHPLSARVCGLR